MVPRDDAPRTGDAGHVDASGGGAEAGADRALPGGAGHALPAGADRTLPGGADRTQPGGTDRAQPGAADRTQPGGAGRTQPGGADRALPGSAADAPAAEPHDLRLVVWDTPPAIERGKRFDVKLGLTCPAGCRPAGWTVEVRDHEGERRATATLGDAPWPGTGALYGAEVALLAPDTEGLHAWEAAALTDGLPVAHAGGSARFGVRVVSAPACAVTVIATDAESRTPVEGLRVVAHPYRTVTDERGVATLQVPAGQYRLFVSGKGYAPFRFDGEVDADTTIRAALVQDVELSDADIWS